MLAEFLSSELGDRFAPTAQIRNPAPLSTRTRRYLIFAVATNVRFDGLHRSTVNVR
jgi:hypothetical protein